MTIVLAPCGIEERIAARAAGLISTLLIVLALALPAFAKIDAKTFEAPKKVSSFALKDHRGAAFDNRRLEGRWTLVLLGYTHCPDVCPFTLSNLAHVFVELQKRLPPSMMPQVVFVGVDPERDAAVLADYVVQFHKDFVGATGDPKEINKLVQGLEGFVRLRKKGRNDEGYLVDHTASVSVIGPAGRLRAQLNPPFNPPKTAEFLINLIGTK